MALLWLDGFEANDSSDYILGNTSIGTSNPRTGTRAINSSPSANYYWQYVFGSNLATSVIGVAIRPTSNMMLALYDGATEQLRFTFDGSNCSVYRGSSTLLATHSCPMLKTGIYYYVEILATIDNASGAYEVRVDGATVGTGSSLDTQVSGNAYATVFRCTGIHNADDFYVCDTSGADCNTFLGPVRIEHLVPNANGTTSGMTGSDGDSTNNYLLVDELVSNGDTDYVQASASGTKDTYNITNLNALAYSVGAVALRTVARKDGGTASLVTVVRHSGSEADSAAKTLTDSYASFYDLYGAVNPVSSGAWSVSDINNLEVGVKVG